MDVEHSSAHPLLAPSPEYLASIMVCPLIQTLKQDVTETLDSALSWKQLTTPDVKLAGWLALKYLQYKDEAGVYACLVVRSYFLAHSETSLALTGVMKSRANLCEILAIRLLGRFASHRITRAAVLCTAWSPLAGATPQLIQDVKDAIHLERGSEIVQTAIELAVATRAKAFIASPVAQNVVNDLYSGNVVFSLNTKHSFLADNYKPRAIQIYDVRKTHFLNHYRLRVPRYGVIMEFINFSCLTLAFILCLATQDKTNITFWEAIFILLASACVLGEYTVSVENGWKIYIENMWNVFDFSFILIFLAFLCFRIKGLYYNDLDASDVAFDILACGACVLLPRLVFFAVANHVIILSIRAMIAQFVAFMGTVTICFSGLLFTLWILANSAQDPSVPDNNHGRWTFSALSWYIIQIWIGNGYFIFAQASTIHPIFGPLLVTIFAVFSNIFLVTTLASFLTNTVIRIDANATQEYLFQFAISTIEGVKKDSLSSYQPPFNIMALLVLKPASWFLSTRALHKVHVYFIRVTAFPQLLAIAIYERYLKSPGNVRRAGKKVFGIIPQPIKRQPFLDALVGPSRSNTVDAIPDAGAGRPGFVSGDGNEDGLTLTPNSPREKLDSISSKQPQVVSINFPSSGSSGTRSRVSSHKVFSSTGTTANPTITAPQLHTSSVSTSGREQRGVASYGAVALSPSLHLSIPPSGDGSSGPLAGLSSNRMSVTSFVADHTLSPNTPESISGFRKAYLEEVQDLPVAKLREEMKKEFKELQEQQAKIEKLLLTLKSARGDVTGVEDS